jgi:hypothetical protein
LVDFAYFGAILFGHWGTMQMLTYIGCKLIKKGADCEAEAKALVKSLSAFDLAKTFNGWSDMFVLCVKDKTQVNDVVQAINAAKVFTVAVVQPNTTAGIYGKIL